MEMPADILPLLPQQPPFVMIGRLLFANEKSTRTSLTIQAGNILVENGFFSEAGLLENMAQTAAAGAGFIATQQNKPVKEGYIGAVKNFIVEKLPQVNEKLITEVILEERIFNIVPVQGTITCNDKVIASCEMKIFMEV